MPPEDPAAIEHLLAALRREQETTDPGSEPPTSEEVWAFAADALGGNPGAMSEQERAAVWQRIVAHRVSAEELGWAVHALKDDLSSPGEDGHDGGNSNGGDAMSTADRETTADLAIQRAKERGTLTPTDVATPADVAALVERSRRWFLDDRPFMCRGRTLRLASRATAPLHRGSIRGGRAVVLEIR